MKENLKTLLALLAGNLLLAFSVSAFVLPYDILSGGVAGIAVLVKPFTTISEQTIIIALVILLFLVGWVFLGKKFAITTIMSSVLYPAYLLLLQNHMKPVEVDPLLASVFGGLIAGAGIGLVMKVGSSTGGMDIPPLIMQKYLGFDLGKSVMAIDALTVIFGLWIYDLQHVLIGLIYVYASGIMITKALTLGLVESMSVQIISDKYEELSALIQERVDRGVTLFHAEGGYLRQQKNVILVVISKHQYQSLLNLIRETDPAAFVIISDVKEVQGNGFSYGARI
ncbi:MAG: YitT family protein [Erysipelotrichaceae bacterium]|nr:YitT family protein [Erysipelotrichaceae bacterium]MBR3167372.1 YitT family protein [Erysipelotrichaceae bacterium]